MGCKGCEVKESARNVDVQLLIQEQLALEPVHLAPEVVARRIATCEKCSARSFHTCTKCGCYYAFRAHLAQKECPQGLWEPL